MSYKPGFVDCLDIDALANCDNSDMFYSYIDYIDPGIMDLAGSYLSC